MNDVMPNFLKKRAFLTPDRKALIYEGQALTFSELYEQAKCKAGELTAQGLCRDLFAGVLLSNHMDSVILLFSLQLLGVKAVILNNRLSQEEIIYQLIDSKASFLITEEIFETDVIEDHDELTYLKVILKENLSQSMTAEAEINEEISLKDVCSIMYTSGTTGNPKGVMQTYGNHWWSAMGSALNLGLSESDCWLCAVPIFHISGYSILMRGIIYGIPIVLHNGFDEQRVLEDITEKNVTIMSAVSLMLTRLVERLGDERLPSTFRCMLLGGGPAPLPLLEACERKSIPVFQTYGMTETSSQIATLPPEYSISKLGSAGKPLFPAQLKILLPDGRKACPFEAGEIVVKGENVTSGYLNLPSENAPNKTDGWFHSGDIGYLDDEGFLFVLDRRSDLIISGGENIYPAEIESVLLEHENIVEAGVTGVADEKWGQIPAAFVVLKSETEFDENEVKAFCSTKLAKYKIPKIFTKAKALPRNASNKLLRRELYKLMEKE